VSVSALSRKGAPIGLGVHGLGTAGALMLGAALKHERFRVAAVSDLRVDQLPLSALSTDCHRFGSLDDLLGDDTVQVVHVATPTDCHFDDVCAVLASGRRVVVEKPMTTDVSSAARLVELCAESGRVVVVGHSRSFDPDVQAIAELVRSGVIGEVEFVWTAHYTEWLRRPRLAAELDPALGGGIIKRQGVHQIDVVRTVLGADHLELVAAHRRYDRERGVVGSYMAWFESTGGVSVAALVDGIGGMVPHDRVRSRPSAPVPEERMRKRRLSDAMLSAAIDGDSIPIGSNERDELVVFGNGGEISSWGGEVRVSDPSGAHIADLSSYRDGRSAVLDEMVESLVGVPPRHDAAWGLENMRLCEDVQAADRWGHR
jgi:phthalate 4,5-cis-dihydrodiol dehydrogenase